MFWYVGPLPFDATSSGERKPSLDSASFDLPFLEETRYAMMIRSMMMITTQAATTTASIGTVRETRQFEPLMLVESEACSLLLEDVSVIVAMSC